MDDRRFDSLAKELASGKSRRAVLKGLLGLGGVALGGAAALSDSTEAARRPTTPTPTPTRCPGQQYVSGGQCVCPPGKTKCGPDCCNTSIPAPDPAHSECCDNACCFGTCLPEEVCCPTNNRPGNLPPTHQVCAGPNGQECCPASDRCCLLDGCCDTVCYGGMVDADYCCSAEQFCPGGSESEDLCCTGGTTCCGAGTNANACVDYGVQGACCTDADCGEGDPCLRCNPETNICEPRCGNGEVCCTDQAGPGRCQRGTCCPGEPCPGGGCQECGVDPSTGIAQCTDACYPKTCCTIGDPADWYCPAGECCPNGQGCPQGSVCCGDGADAKCVQGSTCTPSCEPNCDCSDPANDGLACNGGLNAGGGVCACGFCVVPLDGCPCGCAGDDECVRCNSQTGECEVYNQGGPCNGGEGTCQGEWCLGDPCAGVDCGECGICNEDGDCVPGTCSGPCETCLLDATGQYVCVASTDPCCGVDCGGCGICDNGICLQGACIGRCDVCAPDATGQRYNCVPSSDPCCGVSCTGGTVCSNGQCVCAERVACVNLQRPECPNLCPVGSQPGMGRALAGACCSGDGGCCSGSCVNGICQ